MAPDYDVGMSVDEIKVAAETIKNLGAKAKTEVTTLMSSLNSVSGSWWGSRSADAQTQIKNATDSINQFYKEIEEMSRILVENAGDFQSFDQRR